MTRLQLATLISWADDKGVQGRKRLQKVVYLLQEAGCPLDCEFTLHHYGPYSRDVAEKCDEMVSGNLIEEHADSASGATQYGYRLAPMTYDLLKGNTEPRVDSFRKLGESLLGEKIWPLELGSTIMLFHRQGHDWDKALQEACDFKKVQPETSASQEALALAKRVLQSTSN